MRFAERSRYGVLLALVGAGILGCATPTPSGTATAPPAAAMPSTKGRDATTGALSATRPTGAAPAGAAVAAQPARAPEPVVPPAAQRAFDDARRALRAGRIEEAQRGFEALAQTNPELGGVHANLGLIHRQAGRLVQAVAALEQAVKASPAQPQYWNQLGIARRMHGQFVPAREAYEKAIALDPGYAAPVLNLGILSDLYLGDGRRALELYGRYLVLSPGGDATVDKWVMDLKNRKVDGIVLGRKERP